MKKFISNIIILFLTNYSLAQENNFEMNFRFNLKIEKGDYLFYKDKYFPIDVAKGNPETFNPDEHFIKVAQKEKFEDAIIKYDAYVITAKSEYAYVKTNDGIGWIKYDLPISIKTKNLLRTLLTIPIKTHSQTGKNLGSDYNYLQVTPFNNQNFVLVKNETEGYSIINLINFETTWKETSFQSVRINFQTDNLEINSMKGRRTLNYYGNEVIVKNQEQEQAINFDSLINLYRSNKLTVCIGEFVEKGSLKQIDSIINSGFKIDSIYNYRIYSHTLLGHAVLNDNISLIKYLLEKGASVSVKNKSNEAPICYVKSVTAYDLLLKYGATLYMISNKNSFVNRRTYPTELFFYKYPSILQRVAETAPDSLLKIWEFYGIILQVFIDNNDTISLEKIYKRGVSFNKPEEQLASQSSYQPIFYSKTPEVLKFFVRHKAILINLDEFGNDAQTKAIQWRDSTLVNWLELRGAPLKKPNNSNFASLSDTTFMNFLIKKGVSINSTDRKGRTALIRAGIYDNEQSTVKYLLRHGADINIIDRRGMKYKQN